MKKVSNNKMANIFVACLAAIIVVSLLAFAALNSQQSNQNVAQQTIQTDNTGKQIIKVSVVGSNYVMQPNQLKMGVPARLEFDMSTVVGCSRSVVLPEFGVRKMLSQTDNAVEFTPLKTGNFRIACSMNMYTGQFVVVPPGESNAAVVQNVQNAPSNKPSQIQTSVKQGGGCGCGMMGGSGGSCGAMI